MLKNIVIIGASEHGRVIADIIEKENKYNLIGFIDSQKDKKVDLWQYSILGSEDDLVHLIPSLKIDSIVIAIGDNYIRKKVYEKLVKIAPQLNFGTCIHPSSIIGKNVKIGEGSVIMAGVIINPNSVIGSHCILNTKCSLDHDSSIADFSSLAPNVSTGGNVHIGSCTAIGLSASIIHGKTIGNNSVIGASSLVVTNFKDEVIAYGVPAKFIRNREIGERYL